MEIPFGFFETIFAVRGRPVLAQQHVERLIASGVALGFPVPSREEIVREIKRAASGTGDQEEAVVRCEWVTRSLQPDPGAWQLRTSAGPIPPEVISRRANGRVFVLDASFARQMPEYKTIGDAARMLARREAARRNTDEALFSDRSGRVLEGASTNVFALSGDVLRTPPNGGILPGTVRAWVLENAPNLGFRVEEVHLTVEDLLGGSFLTSSLTPLAPIRSVNGQGAASLGKRYLELSESFRLVFPPV